MGRCGGLAARCPVYAILGCAFAFHVREDYDWVEDPASPVRGGGSEVAGEDKF